ncbi:MAG: hypothetical protein QXM89_02920 [Candidatus Bathyarchaeia archaeon]
MIKTPTKEARKLRGLLKRLDVDVDECETILMETHYGEGVDETMA